MDFIPLAKPFIEDDDINEVVTTLKTGWLSTGPKTNNFEEEFKKYIGCKNAIAVNSCTSALHLSLVSAGIKDNDEVITTPFTFVATSEVILYQRAKPVFIDIHPDTLNINEELIEEKITENTKAIIPVHYGGHPCEMDKITKIAKKYSLKIIEDAAHAISAEYNNTKIGKISDFTCFSFYATKNLTTGEGGMITTENNDHAEQLKILRLHGISQNAWNRYNKDGSWKYDVLEKGYKYNLPDICSALGLSQLKKIEKINKLRKDIFEKYNDAFEKINEIEIPKVKKNVKHAHHLYPIIINQDKLKITRDQIIEELKSKNIGASVHFIPLHEQTFYKKKFNFKDSDFPIAHRVGNTILSLPFYPSLKEDEINHIIDTIKKIIMVNRK